MRFTNITKHSERVLDLAHSNVWGPVPVSARGGVKYFITFIDDYSRKVWLYLIKEKSEVFIQFRT